MKKLLSVFVRPGNPIDKGYVYHYYKTRALRRKENVIAFRDARKGVLDNTLTRDITGNLPMNVKINGNFTKTRC